MTPEVMKTQLEGISSGRKRRLTQKVSPSRVASIRREGWTESNPLGSAAAYAAIAATNWLFWFVVARSIITIKRTLAG